MSEKLILDKEEQLALLTKDIRTLKIAEQDKLEGLYKENIDRCFVVVKSWAKEIYPIYRTIHRITGVSKGHDGGYKYEIDEFCVRKRTTYTQIFTNFVYVPAEEYKFEDYTEISLGIYIQLKNYYNKWLVDFTTGFDQLITRQILNKDIENQPVILRPSSSK